MKEVKFRGHTVAIHSEQTNTLKIFLNPEDGIAEEKWNELLADFLFDVGKELIKGERKCKLYDFKKGKFVEPML
jgi:hypothetical protein